MSSGCSHNVPDSDEILKGNEDYKSFISLTNNYTFDENNYYDYKNDTNGSIEIPEGKIHVSFANNSFLSVTYFYDNLCTQPVDTKACFISDGDKIYALQPLVKSSGTNKYDFDGFQVYCIDRDGSRIEQPELVGEKSEQGYYTVLTIPAQYKYNEISVIPVGKYDNRVITLNDYYIDSNNEQQSIEENEWTILLGKNSIPTNNDTVKISPVTDYIVRYKYDPNVYYFSKSMPEPWHYDDKTGYVEFHQQSASIANDTYNVELGRNCKFSIKTDSKIEVSLDGLPFEICYGAESGYNGYARKGVTVKIKSSDLITAVIAENLNKVQEENDGRVWVYEVNDNSGKYIFNPTDYKYENGGVKFYNYSGIEINEPMELSAGDTIYYEGFAYDGYYFNRKAGKQQIIVDSNTEYELKNELRFEKKWEIYLRQPSSGGKIIYYLNGEEVKTEKIAYLDGTDILTARFEPASGFKCSVEQDTKAIITETNRNVRFSNGVETFDANKVFTESTEHKPKLDVSLDSSVGKELCFDVYADNGVVNTNGRQYDNPTNLFAKNIVEKQEIGTTAGVRIAVTSGNLPSGEALRFDIVTVDNNKNKVTDIEYLTNIPENLHIALEGSIYYTSVTVKVSRVKVVTFNRSNYSPMPNTLISFTYADVTNNVALVDGCVIEEARKVVMTVTPNDGYSLSGKGVKNNKYVKEIAFSKLGDEYRTMIKNIEAVAN